MVQVTATPVPSRDPILSGEVVLPGQPPIKPEPIPDCTKWRYFVERWDLDHIDSRTVNIPVITGYDKVTHNMGGVVITYDIPRFVHVSTVIMTCHYEWVAEEYTGCGTKITTHKSGVKTQSSMSFTNDKVANALIASEAQRWQVQEWTKSLVDSANRAGQQAMMSSTATSDIVSGVYQTAEQGIRETQARIDAMMRDYAERMNVYNQELESHQKTVAEYERYQDAMREYENQLEVTSSMIREDKLGTAYTVKGAGSKTVSLTVGQEITGAELISSGIQSTGSGFNVDPSATYIITDVVLTRDRPRTNVPGLRGTSFPGKIVITK